jgi:uncharacterized membrane protein YGL010W
MSSSSRSALDLLAMYAEYHRDRRNIATHLVGVPMIVFGVGVLLSKPLLPWLLAPGWALTPAWIVFALVAAWYLTRGEVSLGLATALAVGLLMLAAHRLPGTGLGQWLAWGGGFFAVGWIIQFIGHYYEGRKPAFVDDLIGLLVGPMFIVLEALAPLGLFKRQMMEIERRVGPTMLRNLAHPA